MSKPKRMLRKTKTRHHEKVLKTILSLKKPYENSIVLDKSFYSHCGLPAQVVDESLNALAARSFIELIPPVSNQYPVIEIKQSAYTYFPERQDAKFKFWIPIIISIIALVKSFMPELLSLSEAILKLLKQ